MEFLTLGTNRKKNKQFFIIAGWITKAFYIWAKHYIGYFLNYAKYLDRFSEAEQTALYGLLITSSFATTISLFLHTLKFKGYLGPVKAYLIYMASYLYTFYYFYVISYIFIQNLDICAFVFVGIVVNLLAVNNMKYQYAYQTILFALFSARRYGYLESSVYLK